MIYLDNSATTRVCPEAVAAMTEAMTEDFFNPSALYAPSAKVKVRVDEVRALLLKELNCPGGQVIFTSGGTESDNLAVMGHLSGQRQGRVLYTAGEHPAVREAVRAVPYVTAEEIPLTGEGLPDLEALAELLRDDVKLICVMQVNNETGAVSPLKENLRRLSAGVEETASSSFRTFVSKELFEEIDEYIGRPKDSYRVGSVGLYSSVPLLNGFQCVDGYSNNYDVEYKHAFRETIEGELKKKKSVRTYFDEWGNRCYLFSAELGKSYFFTKEDDTVIKKLALNPEALRALGCEYIFSGVEIEKPEKSGLKLLNTFEKEGYPYRIRVYEVESGDEE